MSVSTCWPATSSDAAAHGHSNGPHFHFEVDAMKDCIGVTEKGDRGSIPVLFDTYGGARSLVVGTSYEAE